MKKLGNFIILGVSLVALGGVLILIIAALNSAANVGSSNSSTNLANATQVPTTQPPAIQATATQPVATTAQATATQPVATTQAAINVQAIATSHSVASKYLAWTTDGERLAVVGGEGRKEVLLLDKAGKLINTLKGHTVSLDGVAWSPDGQMLASSSGDKTIRLWGRDGQFLRALTASGNFVWSSDSKALAVGSGIANGIVSVIDTDSGKTRSSIASSPANTSGLNGSKDNSKYDGNTLVSWSPDSQMLAIKYFTGRVQLWSADNKLIGDLSDIYNGVEWSPDSKTLAAASINGKGVQLWSAQAQLEATLSPASDGTGDSVIRVRWSPDGKTLATDSSKANTITLWSVLDRKVLATISPNVKDILTDLAWSPDGSMLAAAGFDKTKMINIWDANGKLVNTISSPTALKGGVSLAWTPDSKALASWIFDNKAETSLWSVGGKALAGPIS